MSMHDASFESLQFALSEYVTNWEITLANNGAFSPERVTNVFALILYLLGKVPILGENGLPVVGMGKHLCGAATGKSRDH